MAKKKSKKKVIILIIIFVVIAGAIAAAVLRNQNDDVIRVTSVKADRRTITQTVAAIGKIQPETEVKISSETPGEIVFLGVKEGDTVHTGDLLVKVKPDIVETQLDQFRAAAEVSKMDIEVRRAEMNRMKSELRRATELYKKEFLSQQEFDKVKAIYEQSHSSFNGSLARYQQSLAGLKQIERSVERTTIIAPIDGIVTKLDVEKGEKVVGTAQFQGTELMRISDLTVMNAVVDVDENDIVHVETGDTTDIEIDAFPDEIFNGIVIEIGHSAKVNQLGSQDQVTNFEVKIRLIDIENRLRPGMSCNVEIKTETKFEVVSVPLQAVTVRDSTVETAPDIMKDDDYLRKNKDSKVRKKKRPPSVVFLNDNGTAKISQVEIGISDKGFIEIIDGISQGDEVINGPFKAVSKLLKNGAKIKIDSTLGRRRFGKSK